MYLAQIITDLSLKANEISFLLGVTITALFYAQYKKYEQEIDREEMLDRFLSQE